LQIADCRLQIADCRLQIADCRLQIADYGVRTNTSVRIIPIPLTVNRQAAVVN